ncbi:MAG: DUF2834 domain-containing protein [Ketobacter sp.]|uniref:DUF2834 domain-containing protein n=1 Tax=Ketobacter sp. MCCC 1A13808 TaxID=2602738 RepID=UPI0018DBB1D1|nr:DUF2834 domain-containing protein [Ketobacter sp. MCCC 1A13808]
MSRFLFYFYIATGILALIFTWVHVPAYLGNGILDANINFWKDALIHGTPSGNFLAVDILFYALIGSVFMVLECRRLGIKFAWLYVFAGILIAISFAFPLFLAMRERHIAQTPVPVPPAPLKTYDILGLAVYSAAVLAAAIIAL